MIICDLEHLEVVGEESRIEGGVQLVSGSSASSSGAATDGSVFTGNSSFSSASQQPFVISPVDLVHQSLWEPQLRPRLPASASGSTSPFF
jgi:hypothetical protein